MIKTRTIIDVALCDLNTGQIDWLPKNPRTWSQADLDRTVASLQEDPDWIEDKPLSVVPYHNEAGELRYCVFCGNLRNSAQKELGIEKTPAFIYDPDAPDVGHEKEKRTPEQIETDRETIRRRAIKDNGTFGSWDSDELANWGVEPEQLLSWGVPDWTMGGAGTGAKGAKSNGHGDGGAKDDGYAPRETKTGERCKTGDIWKLGEHRLVCGDCTDPVVFDRLFAGGRADVAFTSPPYNILNGFNLNQAQRDGYLKGKNVYNDYEDNRTPEDYAEFLTAALDNCLLYADDALFNIGYTTGALKGTALFLGKNADRFGGAITWRKNNAYMPFFPAQHGILGNITEPVYIFAKGGGRKLSHPQWDKGDVNYNLIETESACANEYADENSATFPVSFAAEVINRFTERSVLDCFGGTGTTLIAAEQLGRKCYMVEIDAHYCDIIIDRWEKLTGQTAELIEECTQKPAKSEPETPARPVTPPAPAKAAKTKKK